jgi:hypothetical protein
VRIAAGMFRLVERSKQVKVKIPPGVEAGNKVSFDTSTLLIFELFHHCYLLAIEIVASITTPFLCIEQDHL